MGESSCEFKSRRRHQFTINSRMRIVEIVKREPVDQTLPYDNEKEENRMRKDHEKEPWRGPHEGRILTLLLSGRKPIALVDDWEMAPFEPYIKNGTLEVKPFKLAFHNGAAYDSYVVFLPGQERRANRLQKVYSQYDDYENAGKTDLWHSRMGILLGYSNRDIRKFLNQ